MTTDRNAAVLGGWPGAVLAAIHAGAETAPSQPAGRRRSGASE